MRSAQPRDFVRTASGTYRPVAGKPGGGGGTVTGASWPNGKGDISKSEGKVFFSHGWQQLAVLRHAGQRPTVGRLLARADRRPLRVDETTGDVRHQLGLHPRLGREAGHLQHRL